MNGPFNLKETLTPTLKKINELLTQNKGTYLINELSPGAKILPKAAPKQEEPSLVKTPPRKNFR